MAASRMLALVMLGGMGAAVWAQSPAAPKLKDCELGQDSTEAAPCKPVSAADRFKFSDAEAAAPPVGSSSVDAPAASPVDAPLPSGGAAASSPGKGSSAGGRSPFSGEDSSSSSSAGSESSSSSSNVDGDVPPPENNPDTPKLADKGSSGKKGKAMKVQTLDERVDEDLQVGNFYRGDGNFQGAYLRAKDAFALLPDDAEVNLLYAEVAQKLGKKDEALEHYRAYLKIDPKGKKVADAEQAVEQLSGAKK